MTDAGPWQLDELGWLDGVAHLPSPNFDQRPDGVAVELIVVHAISLPPGEFGGDWIDDFFCNRLDAQAHPYFAGIAEMCVSAHFLIRRSGRTTQFVSTRARAWHAGRSVWRGRDCCNDFSIGIELEGCDECGFEPAQYERLRRLVSCLQERHPICSIAAHSDIAPGRKTDPGPHFDWRELEATKLPRS